MLPIFKIKYLKLIFKIKVEAIRIGFVGGQIPFGLPSTRLGKVEREFGGYLVELLKRFKMVKN